jgi:uncharacterized protein involved in exopolysaccharide biosynthesis
MNDEIEAGVPIRSEDGGDIDLGRAFRRCWARRKLIFAAALLFGVITLGLALVIPKRYTAWTLVTVVASQRYGGQGLSALTQFSGISRLAGMSLPGNKNAADRIALLESRVAIGAFITRENLMPILFADRWDAATKSWRVGAHVPTLYDGIRYFKKRVLTVVDDQTTGLIKVRMEWTNPETATKWANAFVQGVNDFARQRAVSRARRHLRFLNARAQTERYVSQQEAIARLTEGELGQEMIASGSGEYAFKVIDPAMVPEKASFPRPALWTILGILFGGFLSTAFVLIKTRPTRSTHEDGAFTAGRENPPDGHGRSASDDSRDK